MNDDDDNNDFKDIDNIEDELASLLYYIEQYINVPIRVTLIFQGTEEDYVLSELPRHLLENVNIEKKIYLPINHCNSIKNTYHVFDLYFAYSIIIKCL